jgi:hypothetical protein
MGACKKLKANIAPLEKISPGPFFSPLLIRISCPELREARVNLRLHPIIILTKNVKK